MNLLEIISGFGYERYVCVFGIGSEEGEGKRRHDRIRVRGLITDHDDDSLVFDLI